MNIFDRFTDVHSHSHRGPDVITNLREGDSISTPEGLACYSAGLHPWDTEKPFDWLWLERTVADPRVVAVGECGLDRIKGAPLEEQEKLFRRQVALSELIGKPLIIHCVRAYAEMLRLRAELKPSQPWLIHGFRGKSELARQLIAAGFLLSLPKNAYPEWASLQKPGIVYRESD